MNDFYSLPANSNTCSYVRQIAGCLKFRARFLTMDKGFNPSGRVADTQQHVQKCTGVSTITLGL